MYLVGEQGVPSVFVENHLVVSHRFHLARYTGKGGPEPAYRFERKTSRRP